VGWIEREGGSSFNKAVSDASERIAFEHKATPGTMSCPTHKMEVAVMALMRTEKHHLRHDSIGDTIVACASPNEYIAGDWS
jgi:hypothetical protein